MHLPALRLSALSMGVTLLMSCASAPQQGRGDRNTLTRAEVQEAGSSIVTARDAVRVLRPQWLTPPRGKVASSNVLNEGGGQQRVIVYIDDARQPEYDALTTVPAAKILELKYLDQNRAVLLRGPGHEGGVIEVTTTDKRK